MKNLIITVLFIVSLLISCGDSSTNPVDSKPYKITFWSDFVNSAITVKINGITVGEITTAYPYGISGCDSVGCVTIGYEAEQEIILFASESKSGKIWQDTILVKDSCQKYELKNTKYPPTYDLYLHTKDEGLALIEGWVTADEIEYKIWMPIYNAGGNSFHFSSAKVQISAFSSINIYDQIIRWDTTLTLNLGYNEYVFKK